MSSDYGSSLWKSDSRGCDDSKLLSPHVEEYARMAQTCIEKMSRLWNEIELPRDERRGEVDDIYEEVCRVWGVAVERAQRKKEERQEQIDRAIQEIYR